MTKLTRRNNSIQWKCGIMLGWNSSRRMDGIMRHYNNATATRRSDVEESRELFEDTVIPNSGKPRVLVSSFFPQPPSMSPEGGGGGSGGGAGLYRQRPATTRPLTRRQVYEPQKDFSPEFLDYLKNLSKNKDFEHAVEENHKQNDNLKSMLENNIDLKGSKVKSKTAVQRKPGGNVSTIHGYQFFGMQTAPPLTVYRPITVPRYLSTRKDKGRRGIEPAVGKSLVRPISRSPVPATLNLGDKTGSNTKERALTKSKVSPSEVEDLPNKSEGPKPLGATLPIEEIHSPRPLSRTPSQTASVASDSDRPSSSCSSSGGSKRVTFAADVVNYERESKPTKKRKFPKRRRQGFPHPSRGIFVPPDVEIVESSGPSGNCKDNPYLNFTQVWTHPAARSSGESTASRVIRQERFHRVMNDLEHAHIHYNRLVSIEQNDYLINSIFKRYILVLDLALTEGHLTQVEHLLDTISKSIPVLQQNTFYYLYGPKMINDSDLNSDKKEEEHPDLLLTDYALSRISGPNSRQEHENMSIETVLVKLCLELVQLVFSHYTTAEFRNVLTTIPFTVKQALVLLRELKKNRDAFCYIKWINNSAVQRDYRSVLKNLALLDRYGCRADVSPPASPPIGKLYDELIVKSKAKRANSKRSKTPHKTTGTDGMQQPGRPPSRGRTP